MAKNKKPRKPYHPVKIRLPGSHCSPRLIGELKSQVNRVALFIEVTLPRGEVDDEQMHCIQDLFNWGGVVVYLRKLKGQEDAKNEFFEFYKNCLEALNDVMNRKKKGISTRYVCTSHELDLIRDVGADICRILNEALDIAPQRTVREFMAVKQLVDDDHERREKLGLPHGVHELDEDLILRYLEKAA
jgi:hypothetical protein